MFGANISQLNSNVNDDNYQDKVFSSFKPSFTIREKVTIPITTYDNGNYTEAIYTHSYNYIPQVLAYVTTINGEYINIPHTWYYQDDDANYSILLTEEFNCVFDNMAIYIEARTRVQGLYFNPFGPGNGTIDEYIVQPYSVDLIIGMEEIAV